jgi:predicted RNA binding protein YcfA (HicA-like mRNA interferase family)
MRTTAVLGVLEKNGWRLVRHKGGHKQLEKNGQRYAFNYHKAELGTVQIKELARKTETPLEEFFGGLEPDKKPKVVHEIKEVVIKVVEGPIASGQELRFLRADQLIVDHRYQRPLKPQWARYLLDHWQDNLLGVLTVSERDKDCDFAEGGSLSLLEGQHRVATLIARGEGARKLPCIVMKGLTLQQEADVYIGRNTVNQQTQLALYHAKLAALDPLARSVHRIVEETYHIKIGPRTKDDVISFHGISTLFRLQQWGILRATLEVWDESWRDGSARPEALRASILTAIGAVLKFYGKQVDVRYLIKKLSTTDPQQLVSVANARTSRGGAVMAGPPATWIAVAEMIRERYNHGKQTGKLPPFEATGGVLKKWGRSWTEAGNALL